MFTYRRGNILNTNMSVIAFPLTLRECRYKLSFKLGLHKCILSEFNLRDRNNIRRALRNSSSISEYTVDFPMITKPKWKSNSMLLAWITEKHVRQIDKFVIDKFFRRLEHFVNKGVTTIAIPNFCKYHEGISESDFIDSLQVFLKLINKPWIKIELWNMSEDT